MLSSIRSRLILLIALIAIPLAASSVGVLYRLADVQDEAQNQALMTTTRALGATVDAELKKYLTLADALGASDSFREGRFEQVYRQAKDASARLPGSWVVVADAQGQQILNTLRGYGDPLPLVQPLELHKQAMASGVAQLGDAIIGPVAQRYAIGLFVPQIATGRTPRDLVIGLDVGIFALILNGQKLPDGWVAGISDRHGRFVARSRSHDQFVGQPISPGWREAALRQREGYFGNVSADGVPLRSAYINLALGGWSIAIGASAELLDAPIRHSIWFLGLIFGALVLLSLVLALLGSRAITGSMQDLVNGAEALLRRDAPVLKRTGVREVDHALTAFEQAGQAIDERERHHRLLVNELNHRVKNTLTIVQAIAMMARHTAPSVAEFSSTFSDRIVSLARTHDLLTEKSWDVVELREVLSNELGPFENANPDRIVLRGDPIPLRSKDAITISMIVHELATNAAKYGALSSNEGCLRVTWSRDPETDMVSLVWTEEGGPAVAIPSRTSFGTTLINTLTADLAGDAHTEYHPAGLRFSLTARIRPLERGAGAQAMPT